MKTLLSILSLLSVLGWLFIILKPLFKYGFKEQAILNVNIKLMWIFITLIWVFLLLSKLF